MDDICGAHAPKGGAAHIAKHPREAPIDRVPDCTSRCWVRIDHHITRARDLGAHRRARAPPIFRALARRRRSRKVFFGTLGSICLPVR